MRCTARKNGMVDRIDHEDRFVVGGSRSDRGEELREVGTAETRNVLEVKKRSLARLRSNCS